MLRLGRSGEPGKEFILCFGGCVQTCYVLVVLWLGVLFYICSKSPFVFLSKREMLVNSVVVMVQTK